MFPAFLPTIRRRASLALFAAAVLTGTSAWAAPTKEELQVARNLFSEAMAEEAAGRYEAALAKFESVQAIKASPSVRYHIAFCEEKLGRIAAALSDYEAARAAASAEISQQVLTATEEPIARLSEQVPRVTLVAGKVPANTSIAIDGKNFSAVGFGRAIPLDPGPHTIDVSAPGFEPFRHKLTLQAQAQVGVQVTLRAVSNVSGPHDPALAPPSETRKEYPLRPLAIATTAGAVVFLGAGIGMILGAGAAHSSALDRCQTNQDGCSGSTVRLLDWGGAASALVGVGLAVTSVVLWTRPGKTVTSSAQAPGARLAVRPFGVALEGTFQ